MAYNLLEFVPEMDMGNVYKVMKTIEASGDEQSADLVKDIWIKLKKETELTQNQHYALNILSKVVEKKGRMDSTGSMRNQIFKAANALGIKLPSAMFATDNSGQLALRYMKAKGIVSKIDPDKLPKPSPWTVPVPWDEARLQVAENLSYFDKVGCRVRKVRPVADPYVQMLFKGGVFTLSIGRKMPGVTGNIWVEPDEAQMVAAKFPRMISAMVALKHVAQQGNGMLVRSHLDAEMKKMFSNRWARQLAYGIAESWLELGGTPVVDTMTEVQELVDG